MAIVRKSLKQIVRGKPDVDWSRLRSTSDRAIARQIAEDRDTAGEVGLDDVIAPKTLRRRLNMTQEQFAAALHIPVATLRNWEQGRNAIDPAARSLLLIVARNPRAALKVLKSAA